MDGLHTKQRNCKVGQTENMLQCEAEGKENEEKTKKMKKTDL